MWLEGRNRKRSFDTSQRWGSVLNSTDKNKIIQQLREEFLHKLSEIIEVDE